MNTEKDTYDCFVNAKKLEEKGKKHKGLLLVGVNDKKAEEYIQKAKTNLSIDWL
jgi:hypothetical protein